MSDAPPSILSLRGLSVWFQVGARLFGKAKSLHAVESVDLEVRPGEALGIVGESGCGKSTLARAVLQLVRPTHGSVVWLGRAIEGLSVSDLRPLRRDMQIVFQDPLASLDPRMTVGEIVAEPLRVHCPELDRAARREEVAGMLERVGLSRDVINRYPHEFSGGQCQRIGIARAMILKPKLLICDEPVSALDVSIQAQIINLLKGLQRDFGMTVLFVSHNLAVVRRMCDRVLVLYLGRTMELAATDALYSKPLHPYTRGLLAAVPVPDPDIQPGRLGATLAGELPSPLAPPSGCVFRTRCAHAIARCSEEIPTFEVLPPTVAGGVERHIACHRWREIDPQES
jgi:oligopeptide transport system ATP-binding protein